MEERRRHITLKEKLTEHYQKRDFKPKKSSASTYGMLFYWGVTVSLLLEGVLILIPNYFKTNSSENSNMINYFCAQLVAIVLAIESISNWILSHFSSLHYVKRETKDKYYSNATETPPGWKPCIICMLDAPPRSHHCTLCNHCILKRDHHCFFTGSCVGYHNQRYFVVFCFYNCLALAYGSCLQLILLNEEIPILSEAAIFYLPPVALWQLFTGTTTVMHVAILFHMIIAIFCFVVSFLFLAWQLLIICQGQTSYEAWKQISVYQKTSLLDNVYSSLGSPSQFLLCLLIPGHRWMPEDGIQWTTETKAGKKHSF
ncbi:probable palmitoyltransferase ZDHHC24 [Physella acuta]|uniref:probable palmitoyltransferase ZDHHC24 n=1 Tax=Physella acuta TaxID=109671 RepID=UPI0027DACDB2|nr:probable palmitoyltransferase ZDHHC24 [Physella acuta]